MFPTLFDSSWIGIEGALHFRIPTYFAAIMAGYLAAVYLALRECVRIGVDKTKYIDFAIWMLIAGVVGSRVFHVLFDGLLFDYINLCADPFLLEGKALKTGELCLSNMQCLSEQDAGRDIGGVCNPANGQCYPQPDCFRALKFWAGGLTVYGAIIATIPTAYWYLKKHGMPGRAILDMGGYGIPLGIALGRLGCLGAGCCFGDVCDIDALGITFPKGTLAYSHHYEHHLDALTAAYDPSDPKSLPVWPTQFLSTMYNFVIFIVAYFVIRPNKRYHGQVMLFFVGSYAFFRFLIEFVRADQRGGIGAVSTSQIIALVTVAAAIYFYFRLNKNAPPPATDESE